MHSPQYAALKEILTGIRYDWKRVNMSTTFYQSRYNTSVEFPIRAKKSEKDQVSNMEKKNNSWNRIEFLTIIA